MTRDEMKIEVVRLATFLDFNQLIQAHAIACKLEGVFKEEIVKSMQKFGIVDAASPASVVPSPPENEPASTVSSPSENEPQEPASAVSSPSESEPASEGPRIEHVPFWKPFKEIIKIKQFCISGTTARALECAKILSKML